ncbi:MAG: porin, partial [Planctomycetota bacterium]
MKTTTAFLFLAATICGVTQAQEQVTLTDEQLDEALERYFEKEGKEGVVRASHGSKGFRLETRDGNFQTNLQWRAQLRLTSPYRSDPRQRDDFDTDEITAEGRR